MTRIIATMLIGIGMAWIVAILGLEMIGAAMRVYDGRMLWSEFTWHYSPFNIPAYLVRLIMAAPGLVAVVIGGAVMAMHKRRNA